MGGGGYPPDRSVERAEAEARAQREAEEREAARKAEERKLFQRRLKQAVNSARASAGNFFSARGLDPGNYTSAITSELDQRRGSVPDLDPSPGSYFDDIGQAVYDAETDAARAGFSRDIDSFAPAGFATRRIGNDLDDPIIAGVLEEAYADSDDYIRNLLDRGVVTTTGYNAALEDLDRQRPGAEARLQELGLGILEGGRQSLRDLASEARLGASNFELGSSFDPFTFQADIDRSFTDFLQGLSGQFRAQAPENIFDTAGLPNIAGAAQGAGNNAFDPNALAGILEEDEEEDEENRQADSTIF